MKIYNIFLFWSIRINNAQVDSKKWEVQDVINFIPKTWVSLNKIDTLKLNFKFSLSL